MSKHHRGFHPSLTPVPAPLVINIEGVSVGLAVSDKHGFRFVAAHPRFDLLDGNRFRRIADIETAAKRLAQATRPYQPSPYSATAGWHGSTTEKEAPRNLVLRQSF